MNILITGISGFVGEYLAEFISRNNPKAKIFGLERNIRTFSLFPRLNQKVKIFSCDITDYNSVFSAISKIKPDEIYHLAGFVSASGKDKSLINKINVAGTINILSSASKVNNQARILLVSSSYVYSNIAKPARETDKLDPHSFYAKSKLEMEKKALKMFKNLKITIVRPVNHSGPGQRLGFVVPDFASQIVQNKNKEILVGNLEAERELLDVQDVVSAYYIVMQKGKSGEIYNISREKTLSMRKLLEKIIKLSKRKITIVSDKDKIKPVDIKINSLNSAKIRKLGWKPKIKLDDTLKRVLIFWKNKLS